MQAFFESFAKYISSTDILILAVSGGVDSMVMLDLVIWSHPRENIIVAHFDHSLRWEESDADRLFVANYCEKKNIAFEVEKMDISSLAREEKSSIEAVARKYRYIFLEKMAEKYRAKYILTAHHLDDRIETVIFNLIRGSKLGGIHALSRTQYRHREARSDPENWNLDCHENFSQKQKNLLAMTGNIFRPLLHITKNEILEYAREHHIEYREDSTNTDTTYLRNHLRHTVLPEFERINPEYRRAIENYIEYTEELKSWIDTEIRVFLWDDWNFLISDFENKSLFLQKEIIRYLYEEANQGTIGLSEWLITELIRFITEGSNSYGIREVKKLRLERRGERILYAFGDSLSGNLTRSKLREGSE
jgi:tRNA(Ile)-lysidine synthase